MKIKPENLHKTVFPLRYKHYKFTVMLIRLNNAGLTNIPMAFIDLMNRVFKSFLDRFVIVLIDDMEEHERAFKISAASSSEKQTLSSLKSATSGSVRSPSWVM